MTCGMYGAADQPIAVRSTEFLTDALRLGIVAFLGRADQRLVAAEGTLKRQGRRIRDEAKDELQRSTEQRKHEADALSTR
jgi:hypothetical protein